MTAVPNDALTTATYYGMPAVKPAPFGWHVGVYLFVSALGGASQLIATIADRCGSPRMRTVARNGRGIALAAALVGPGLLVWDLKTPQRFYNMLRIFRRTSPMSIGTYVLMGYSATSVGCAVSEALRPYRPAPLLLEIPAVAASAGMLTYTGALLSSTSTPLWSSQSPLLSARFASSGIACGAAALSMIETLHGRRANAATLDRLAAVATVTYAAVSACAHAKTRKAHADTPLHEPPYGALHRLASALSIAVPLACHALKAAAPRRARTLSLVAAASTLAGAALARYVELYAGKASAKRPRDYLRQTSGRPERRR